MAAVAHIQPGQAKARYLAGLPDEQAVCLSQGHGWPKIRPGRPLPRGIDAVPGRNGQFQVRETCPSCGTVRTRTTLPGGAFDTDVQYRYEHPRNWVTRHGDIRVTGRDVKAEVWSRFGSLLAGAPAPAAEGRSA